MKKTAWKIWLAVWLLAATSCSLLNRPTAKQESSGRWKDVQGRLKYQLALDNYNIGQLEEAQNYLEESIGLSQTAPEPYILQTKILLEKGETASASRALDRALHNGGNSAELYYLNGMVAERYGRHTEAMSWYQGASERDPINAHYVVAVAETLVALDKQDKALELILSRWTDFENNATLRSLAGRIYMMLGRYEEAANAYREALQIAPDDAMLQGQFGRSLVLSENYHEALPILTKAVGNTDNPSSTILVALGRCQMAMKRIEDSKVTFTRAVQVNGQQVRNWSWLARAALVSDDLATARNSAASAVRLAPDNADLALLLGYVCWRQKDYQAAVDALNKALEKLPDDLMGLYMLGQCHKALKNKRMEEQCHQRALRINPQREWAKRFGAAKEGARSP
ncbi:MAG: tetratricopeptide repeat protein [Planctomycetota bacterium]|jgi:tetratricopeptide (TPR) repeat protein